MEMSFFKVLQQISLNHAIVLIMYIESNPYEYLNITYWLYYPSLIVFVINPIVSVVGICNYYGMPHESIHDISSELQIVFF